MRQLVIQFIPLLVSAIPLTACLLREDKPKPADAAVTKLEPIALATVDRVAPQRNPFRAPQVELPKAEVSSPVETTDMISQVAETMSRSAETASPAVDARVHLQKVAASTYLAATMINGEKRLALIAGKIYHEGMPLSGDDSDVVVSRIGHDRVTIRKGDHEASIHYAASSSVRKDARHRTKSNSTRGP